MKVGLINIIFLGLLSLKEAMIKNNINYDQL